MTILTEKPRPQPTPGPPIPTPGVLQFPAGVTWRVLGVGRQVLRNIYVRCSQKRFPWPSFLVTLPPWKRPRNSSLFSVCRNCGGTCRPIHEAFYLTHINYWRTPSCGARGCGRVFPSEWPPLPAHHLLHLQKRPAKRCSSRLESDGCAKAPEHRDR